MTSEKRPGALRTIGEVSQALGIKHHVLRYWETQFPMLRPVKRSGARRYYRPEDVELLGEIVRLVQGEGYTLRGARHFLEHRASAAKGGPAPRTRAVAAPKEPLTLHESLKNLRAKVARALDSL
ncbi:MerR family transcriptional regulator [Novosphingobium sp. 1949]|uniref:MerR family transcriptional regulator n=1 Tax=Novosphingobium organovorum TaxID=2930092 RepID=A0ABT0B8I7_9SPHN|nr:MerR family transcriptional regulator [Novosphingobium organovorum]MCJ2181170.1 MerR family transcriptional regulator [Novosphingobium organovorum]